MEYRQLTASTPPHCRSAPARNRSHQRRSRAQQSLMPVLNRPPDQCNHHLLQTPQLPVTCRTAGSRQLSAPARLLLPPPPAGAILLGTEFPARRITSLRSPNSFNAPIVSSCIHLLALSGRDRSRAKTSQLWLAPAAPLP